MSVTFGSSQLLQPKYSYAKCAQQSRQRRCFVVVARSAGNARPAGRNQPRRPPRLPDSGFFQEADPKAEVYSPLGGTSRGRYAQEFIWNTNWQKQLEYEESLQRARERKKEEDKNPKKPGVVSFTRLAELNSMDVDLSEQLRPRKIEANSASQPSTSTRSVTDPPTQGELRKWGRSGRYATRAVALDPNNKTEAELLEERVEAERARYKELQSELVLWTLTAAGAIFAVTCCFYPKDVAVSYAVGSVAGLVYLRLLSRTVDAYGGFDLGGAFGQQRLLIPLILALGYNRWNALAQDATGVELLLLPMLLGFFTYKGSVVARQSVSLANEMMASLKADNTALSGNAVDGSYAKGDASSAPSDEEANQAAMRKVEKDFRDKMLMQ